jgi:hypothetical protein
MKTMTSWKEIAAYMGKGIRTVQRWERDAGLPVRRPEGDFAKGPVFAVPEEIEAWVQKMPVSDEARAEELKRLRREVQELRKRLQKYEPGRSAQLR